MKLNMWGKENNGDLRQSSAYRDERQAPTRQEKRETAEWVTASYVKVVKNQNSGAPVRYAENRRESSSPTRQTQAQNASSSTQRDILAEFSKSDGYTRQRPKSESAKIAEELEHMTGSHARVARADIQRRNASLSQAATPQQRRSVPQKANISPVRNQSPSSMQRQTATSAQAQNHMRGNAQKARNAPSSSEWTSVRNVSAGGAQKNTPLTRGASATGGHQTAKSAPERAAKNASPQSENAKIREKTFSRAARKPMTPPSPPPRRKRVFTPVEAERVILLKPPPRKHIISPFTGIYLAALSVFIIVCLVITVSSATKITEIKIKSEDTASLNSDILKTCESAFGKSYLTIDKSKIESEISELSALIADVKIVGSFPRRLHISVTYDTPRYYAEDDDGVLYVMSAQLKVLHIYTSDEAFEKKDLAKLELPQFSVEKAGQMPIFSSKSSYIKSICAALADYEALGHISYISFTNTQRIYFIFNKNFKCELGDANELDLKLKAAENTYRENVLVAVGEDKNRTAVINVSTPSSATYRLDAELGVTN